MLWYTCCRKSGVWNLQGQISKSPSVRCGFFNICFLPPIISLRDADHLNFSHMFGKRHLGLENLNYRNNAFLKRCKFLVSSFKIPPANPTVFLDSNGRGARTASPNQVFRSHPEIVGARSDMIPVLHWEFTSVRRHRTKFSQPGDPAPGFYAPLLSSVIFRVRGCKFSSTASGRRQNNISFVHEVNR